MKRVILLAMVLLLGAVPIAQGVDEDDVQALLGVDGKLAGCFCCVKQTCVVTRNEADCKKIGGVKINNCRECEKAKDKTK
ncbi:hypothetical protein ACFL2Q_06800 [Thermodesulfobacteriota bacterium]